MVPSGTSVSVARDQLLEDLTELSRSAGEPTRSIRCSVDIQA